MDELWRELAPISSEAWSVIDAEARSHLRVTLAARRIVDFTGPLGWAVSAVESGRVRPLEVGPSASVSAGLRAVQPLVELRVPFELSRRETDALARGAKDADLTPLIEAARAMANAEDRIVFHGYAEAGIPGMCAAAKDFALELPSEPQRYPEAISLALARMLRAGVGGPYAVALNPEAYQALNGTTSEGYPVLQHVQRLLAGPVLLAPGLEAGLVASLRGGDFELVVGRDLAIGYQGHTATKVELYMEESLTFRVLAPEAAVPLLPSR